MKITARKQQGILTKERIYKKAIQLITENGYHNVSVTEICNELNLTIGAFYHHFKSKDDIVLEILREHDLFYENEAEKYLNDNSTFENILIYLSLLPKRIVLDENADLTKIIYTVVLNADSEYPLSNSRAISSKLIDLIEEGLSNEELINVESAINIHEELLIISRGIIFNWAESNGSYDLVNKHDKICRNYLECYKNKN